MRTDYPSDYGSPQDLAKGKYTLMISRRVVRDTHSSKGMKNIQHEATAMTHTKQVMHGPFVHKGPVFVSVHKFMDLLDQVDLYDVEMLDLDKVLYGYPNPTPHPTPNRSMKKTQGIGVKNWPQNDPHNRNKMGGSAPNRHRLNLFTNGA